MHAMPHKLSSLKVLDSVSRTYETIRAWLKVTKMERNTILGLYHGPDNLVFIT